MNLLLLRGLIRDQRAWGDFPNRFLAHAPRMKLHFLDLPGVGTENQRPSPSSITAIRIEIAQRFHSLIAQGKFPQGPWMLMGISLGGMVALDWADAEPNLFENLILVNTSAADIARMNERFRLRYVPRMLISVLLNRPALSERLILGIVSNRPVKHPNGWTDRPVSRTTFIRQLLSAARYRLPEKRPRPKTVLISSAGDRLVSPSCSVRLAERFGAPRLTHPWAGHDIPIDDPEWLAREITEWIGPVK